MWRMRRIDPPDGRRCARYNAAMRLSPAQCSPACDPSNTLAPCARNPARAASLLFQIGYLGVARVQLMWGAEAAVNQVQQLR